MDLYPNNRPFWVTIKTQYFAQSEPLPTQIVEGFPLGIEVLAYPWCAMVHLMNRSFSPREIEPKMTEKDVLEAEKHLILGDLRIFKSARRFHLYGSWGIDILEVWCIM